MNVDLERWCITENGYTECAADTLADPIRPWEAAVVRAMLEPNPVETHLATVTHDDRVFLSLAGTVEATVMPLLDRFDAHQLAGMGVPSETPHAVHADGRSGEELDVPLHDNWNVVLFDDQDGEADLTACDPATGGAWQVDGHPVYIEPVRGPTASWDAEPVGLAVGVGGSAHVGSLSIRLERSGSC